MSFVIDCPACRKGVTATPELVGRVMSCPHCAEYFTIPEDGAAPVCIAAPSYNRSSVVGRTRFTFSCRRCGSILEGRGELGGKHGRCPTCGAVFVIPEVDALTGLPVDRNSVEPDQQNPTPMHAYATAGSNAPTIQRRHDGTQVIICPRCKREMPVEADTCKSCGIPFTMDGADAITRAAPLGNGLATASLTVGILALLTPCLPGAGLIAVGLGIAGLLRANRSGPERIGRGVAIAGIACGAVALGWIAWVAFL